MRTISELPDHVQAELRPGGNLTVISTAHVVGISGSPIAVEVHVEPGLPGFDIIGIPGDSCRETRDRVRAAIISSGFTFPNSRITVNFAPSGGLTCSGFDLAIAVGILTSTEVVKSIDPQFAFIGELGLDGSIRPTVGALCAAAALDENVVLTSANDAEQIAELGHDRARGFQTLSDLVAHLNETELLPDATKPRSRGAQTVGDVGDVGDIHGQPLAMLALEIAAAGGHNLLYSGPTGAGKSALAKRIRDILPPLSESDALTVAMAHSAAGIHRSVTDRTAPFRAPYHAATQATVIGGGTKSLRPGEITLAHRGVLFLDNLGEFTPSTLDAFRRPMKDGVIHIARARTVSVLPADFQLLATMTPCPCGRGKDECACSTTAIQRHRRRISGPVFNGFDIRVHVPLVTASDSRDSIEPIATVRDRVLRARSMAVERGVRANVKLSPESIKALCPLDAPTRHLLATHLSNGRLSGRGAQRVRLVARTIADIAGREGPPIVDDYEQAIALRVNVLGTPT